MRPAFASNRQAAAFALLLLGVLLAPLLAGKSMLPPREQIYSSTPVRYGPFQCLDQEIFKEPGDIDIAFVGSSRIMHGIDAAYVQKQLSEQLGRKAVVLTFGWSWAGFDALYFISRDLLQNRKVRMIVFTEECREGDNPHHAAPRWFRFADDADALPGLSLPLQGSYYFAAILGMPRNLLELARPNFPDLEPVTADTWNNRFHTRNPLETLGSISARLGFNAPFDRPNFSDYKPDTGVSAADVVIYSDATKESFHFSDPPPLPLQFHFARLFGTLAQQQQTRLVYLHLPETTEMRTNTIQEVAFWPDVMNTKVDMVGIPPARLFAGMKDEDVLRLYLDRYHFNQNGVDYFTPLITPALLQLYDSATNY